MRKVRKQIEVIDSTVVKVIESLRTRLGLTYWDSRVSDKQQNKRINGTNLTQNR